MATETSALAAPFIFVSGQEVLPIGGYTGTIPEPSLATLESMVRKGTFHLVLQSPSATDRVSCGSPGTACRYPNRRARASIRSPLCHLLLLEGVLTRNPLPATRTGPHRPAPPPAPARRRRPGAPLLGSEVPGQLTRTILPSLSPAANRS